MSSLSLSTHLIYAFFLYSTRLHIASLLQNLNPPQKKLTSIHRCSCLRRPSLKLTILSKAKRDPTIWKVARLGQLDTPHPPHSSFPFCKHSPQNQKKKTKQMRSPQHKYLRQETKSHKKLYMKSKCSPPPPPPLRPRSLDVIIVVIFVFRIDWNWILWLAIYWFRS